MLWYVGNEWWHPAQRRGDPAAEYSRKLEYLKREEELIKEEEMEADALLQPSGQALQVGNNIPLCQQGGLKTAHTVLLGASTVISVQRNQCCWMNWECGSLAPRSSC